MSGVDEGCVCGEGALAGTGGCQGGVRADGETIFHPWYHGGCRFPSSDAESVDFTSCGAPVLVPPWMSKSSSRTHTSLTRTHIPCSWWTTQIFIPHAYLTHTHPHCLQLVDDPIFIPILQLEMDKEGHPAEFAQVVDAMQLGKTGRLRIEKARKGRYKVRALPGARGGFGPRWVGGSARGQRGASARGERGARPGVRGELGPG